MKTKKMEINRLTGNRFSAYRVLRDGTEERKKKMMKKMKKNILSSFAKGRNESLAWFSPLNPDKPALSQAESTLSVAEIALLRRGKALSSSLSSERRRRRRRMIKSHLGISTKSAESKRAKVTIIPIIIIEIANSLW